MPAGYPDATGAHPPRRLRFDDAGVTRLAPDSISNARERPLTVTLSVVRPRASTLDSALRVASTPTQLLDSIGQPELATQLHASLSLDDLLVLAEHEAAVRRHPELGREHVVLAAARVCGDTEAYRDLAEQVRTGRPRRGLLGWRPPRRPRAQRTDPEGQ
jgi:hypothetical protein